MDAHGEPLATGWRTAAWMAFVLAALLALHILTSPSQDLAQAVTRAAGTLLAMLLALLGVVFSIFGATSSAIGERRVRVVLPAVANATLLMVVVGIAFAP
jgi:hypothetical protein